jgi:hypothetical protein
MPPRRYGSARHQLEYLDLLALTITDDERRFGGEAAMEAVYWANRDQVLGFGNRIPGDRPVAFWRFEAKWRPPPDPDPREYVGRLPRSAEEEVAAAERMLDEDRRVELAKLGWLADHDQLEDWERAELLEWATRARGDVWWKYRAGDILELLG